MRTYISCLALLSVVVSTSARAVDTMYVAGFGGDVEKAFRQKIVPPFEAKSGIKVVYVAGNSTDTLARLEAQKGRQEISVAIIDDAPMSLAINAGLCGKIEDGPNSRNVYPSARRANGEAIGLGYGATGLVYNTQVFARHGWPAPTSWNDLRDPRYAGRIVIPPITNGFGLLALVMQARLNGGGETNMDPGFAAMKRIAPGVLDWEASPGKMAELLQTGEASLGVWGTGRVRAMVQQGAPVRFVYPREGALMILSEVCPVKDAPLPRQAQAFIQYLLSPDVQAMFTDATGLGPVNPDTKLSPSVAAGVVYGPESVQKLIKADINAINANRSAWTSRWNREVEQ